MAKPQLIAHFETTEDGKPKFVMGKSRRNYRVVFEVENAPQDTYAATFELDPTYYDPRRTLLPDREGRFRLALNSYGNYDVKVWLRTKEGEIRIDDNLRGALERSRPSIAGGQPIDENAISEALAYIATH